MPLGLATLPATFTQLITIVFSNQIDTTWVAYFYDIIVFSLKYIEMLCGLDTAVERHGTTNLKLTPRHCGLKNVS